MDRPEPETPAGWLHPFTCAYCTGDRDGNRPGWPHREGFEHHMATVHHGLPAEALVIRARTEPETPAAPRTEAGRRLLGVAYLKGDAASEGVDLAEAILAIEAEAAALAACPAPAVVDVLLAIRPYFERIANTMDRSEPRAGSWFADMLRETWRDACDVATRLAPEEPE